MRRVRRSLTAIEGLETLLAQGLPKFGWEVIEEKQRLVDEAIDGCLARHPRNGLRTRGKPFHHYPVSGTPFTVIYDFDAAELRILFIVHSSADRGSLFADDVKW